jgi:pimeloyl-ACP methyl ester carboxylesterase
VIANLTANGAHSRSAALEAEAEAAPEAETALEAETAAEAEAEAEAALEAEAETGAIDWRDQEHDTLIDGRRVHFRDIGEGPLGFVCVHGMGGCQQHWSHTLPLLARHGRAIALDLPGFGGSQPARGRITLDLFADVTAALAREVGLEQVVFLGHSMGGPIALRCAARDPQLTRSLVLLGGAIGTFCALLGLRDVARITRERPKDTAAVYAEVLTCGVPIPATVKRAIARRRLARALALWPYVYRPAELEPATVALILQGAGARGTLGSLRALSQSDPYARVGEIRCPILSIGARHDRIASVTDLEAFGRLAPTATAVLLEDAGHLMMLERPQAVNREISRFLDEHFVNEHTRESTRGDNP